MSRVAGSIRLPFNRPEYVTAPEAFISALAWKIYDAPDLVNPEGKKPVGLYFRGDEPKAGNVEFRPTDPGEGQLDALGDALSVAGLKIDGSQLELAESVLNSVRGIYVTRAKMQPASPISPSFALLQNPRGLLKKQNPPDIAGILQSMYSLGLQSGSEANSVAGRWDLAVQHRMECDALVSALDRAVDNALIGRVERERPELEMTLDVRERFPNTPFEWFVTAWDRLTDPSWVEALPARVWVDWATTILRLAYGAGFLWETEWYLVIAREVVLGKIIRSRTEVLASVGETIPWASSRAGTAARDIAPKLLRKVNQGEHVRNALDEWLKTNDHSELSFEDLISNMRDDSALSKSLLEALRSTSQRNSGKNLWEAIKYALATREASGANADYYGLLQSHGRFLTVSPGTEWIAVVASLACEVPGGTTDVRRVLASLEMLGTRPELSDLVGLLEKAGMARGSADADSGVLVKSAF